MPPIVCVMLLSISTKLSLVPPPWLEFTTSDPSRSATRVSPPGTTWTPFAPLRTNGRKSTWRGDSPLSASVGTVDSASVGWAKATWRG